MKRAASNKTIAAIVLPVMRALVRQSNERLGLGPGAQSTMVMGHSVLSARNFSEIKSNNPGPRWVSLILNISEKTMSMLAGLEAYSITSSCLLFSSLHHWLLALPPP